VTIRGDRVIAPSSGAFFVSHPDSLIRSSYEGFERRSDLFMTIVLRTLS
jgi:hypothetical protein